MQVYLALTAHLAILQIIGLRVIGANIQGLRMKVGVESIMAAHPVAAVIQRLYILPRVVIVMMEMKEAKKMEVEMTIDPRLFLRDI